MRVNLATGALLGFAVVAVLAGCSSSEDESNATSTQGEPTPSLTSTPTLDPASTGRMEIDDRIYLPGDRLKVRWPGEDLRGIAYSLDVWTGQDWKTRYYLIATQNSADHADPPWWDADAKGHSWADVGIGGFGPDVAVVPDAADPGTYRLCTANSRKRCVMLTVG